jgi:hypothetical protein
MYYDQTITGEWHYNELPHVLHGAYRAERQS